MKSLEKRKESQFVGKNHIAKNALINHLRKVFESFRYRVIHLRLDVLAKQKKGSNFNMNKFFLTVPHSINVGTFVNRSCGSVRNEQFGSFQLNSNDKISLSNQFFPWPIPN